MPSETPSTILFDNFDQFGKVFWHRETIADGIEPKSRPAFRPGGFHFRFGLILLENAPSTPHRFKIPILGRSPAGLEAGRQLLNDGLSLFIRYPFNRLPEGFDQF